MTSEPIRVAIVDDHPLFREGVVLALAAERDLAVVAQGSSAQEAEDLVRAARPDVLLLDIDMPGGGPAAVTALAEAAPQTRIVILTASSREDDMVQALDAGAQGYVLKGVSARELAAIVRSIHAGRGYVPPELAAHLLAGRKQRADASNSAGRLDTLTEREQQILDQVASGASNKEIANALHLTEKTVKYYMTSIMQKLQVRNRVEAAMMARRRDDSH